MLQFLNTLMKLKRDEKGVTALEYGLIAALIAAVVIGGVTTIGTNLKTTFENIGSRLNTPASNTAGSAK